MSPESTNPDPLSLDAQERIAEKFLVFSQAFQKGEQPAIEQFLEGAAGSERAELLRELILLEAALRSREHQPVSFADYERRFPHDAEIIAAAKQQFGNEATLPGTPKALPEPGERLQYVGDYEILKEIGRGGMGIVYQARQMTLGRIVAVKMLLNSQFATPEEITRFEREAKITAKLQHPNIVRIHEVGYHEGCPYFSMDYVEGQRLAQIVRTNPLPPKLAARYVQIVTEAIHRAHEEKILHRDLKPSNILIDSQDQVRITDFGLAKKVDAGQTLTESGGILGTPSYMPPEQAVGDQKKIGATSDVYSLGAVLYELLTGRPPFAAATAVETLHQVKTQEPVPPRVLNPKLPKDLNTICLKCLEKESDRRYGSAENLAGDLRNYLEGRPIKAVPIGRLAKSWRWCKRNRMVSISIAAVALVILCAIGVVTLQSEENSRKRASSLVEAVLTAPPQAVPYAIRNLEQLRDYAIPILEQHLQDPETPDSQRLHAACALAKFGQVEVEVLLSSIDSAEGDEFINILMALNSARELALAKLQERIAKASEAREWERKVRQVLLALWLGNTRPVSEMCALTPDRVQRTRFIHTFPKWHGDLSDLAEVCQDLDDDDGPLRSAICLGLGGVSPQQASAADQDAWKPLLMGWYQTATDTGTHGATDWVLRHWNIGLPEFKPVKQLAEDSPWYINSAEMTMLKIPAGQFRMGSDALEFVNEQPSHKVTLTRPFYLSDREVTVGQFLQFIDDGDSTVEKPKDWKSHHKLFSLMEHYPVLQVSWYEAVLYCNWLSRREGRSPCYIGSGTDWKPVSSGTGYRLPTEAEWEYACRAGTSTDYSFGNDWAMLPEYCVFNAPHAEPCGSRLPNGWGLFDMHGNVYEWCHDEYGGYSAEPVEDPMRRPITSSRMFRGGGWFYPEGFCRSAYRDIGDEPDSRSYDRGFRLAAVSSGE